MSLFYIKRSSIQPLAFSRMSLLLIYIYPKMNENNKLDIFSYVILLKQKVKFEKKI